MDKITSDRRILLKTDCIKAGSCCGGGKKKRTRYSVLFINHNEDGTWTIVHNTPSTTNVMELSKKLARVYKPEPAWAGSVYAMGLHMDVDFMSKLDTLGLLDGSCDVVA